MVPSGSLVHAVRRVPSSDSTSWKVMLGAGAARAAEVGMASILPEGQVVSPGGWLRRVSPESATPAMVGSRGGGGSRRNALK